MRSAHSAHIEVQQIKEMCKGGLGETVKLRCDGDLSSKTTSRALASLARACRTTSHMSVEEAGKTVISLFAPLRNGEASTAATSSEACEDLHEKAQTLDMKYMLTAEELGLLKEDVVHDLQDLSDYTTIASKLREVAGDAHQVADPMLMKTASSIDEKHLSLITELYARMDGFSSLPNLGQFEWCKELVCVLDDFKQRFSVKEQVAPLLSGLLQNAGQVWREAVQRTREDSPIAALKLLEEWPTCQHELLKLSPWTEQCKPLRDCVHALKSFVDIPKGLPVFAQLHAGTASR